MKSALKKLLTDTDTQPEPEFNIPSWKNDPEFTKWSEKSQEITQQLLEAEGQEKYIDGELR